MEAIDWVIGVGLMVGLAFLFNYLTFDDMEAFMVYLMIFNGFVVWGGLLPSWTLIIDILAVVMIIYLGLKGKGDIS